jgi:hypothetical protein
VPHLGKVHIFADFSFADLLSLPESHPTISYLGYPLVHKRQMLKYVATGEPVFFKILTCETSRGKLGKLVKCVPVFARTHTQYNYMYIVQCTCKSDANHMQTYVQQSWVLLLCGYS